MFDFAPVLYDLMQSDRTIIVDEIDRSIHANLLKMFVEKVMGLLSLNKLSSLPTNHAFLIAPSLEMKRFGLLRKTERTKVLVSIHSMILSREMIWTFKKAT